jgi:hypothetical protein
MGSWMSCNGSSKEEEDVAIKKVIVMIPPTSKDWAK